MITIQQSQNPAYFQVDGVDYPKSQYTIKYDGLDRPENERIVSIINIHTKQYIVLSRSIQNINGGLTFQEFIYLVRNLGILNISNIPEKPFNLGVSMGFFPNTKVVDKFGKNPTVLSGTKADVWEFGGVYTYEPFGSAIIQYLSSSNINDTQSISILGLDINGNEVEQIVVLDGQNNVFLTTPLWRIYRMINVDSSDLQGIVYCHTSGTVTNGVPPNNSVRAIISNGNNQSLMALYTIPKGFVGFLYKGEVGITLSSVPSTVTEYAVVQYQSRRVGKVFQTKKEVGLSINGSSLFKDERVFPDVIPSLTDVKINIHEISETMGVWATLDILLVDESEFTIEYLQSIGQPNY